MSTCTFLAHVGEKGSDLWVVLLRRAGLPIAEKLTARETLQHVWYWVRVERWPPVPLREKKESLMRSAQARVDYGCVLHVTGARSESIPEAVDLLFMVRSGVQKSKECELSTWQTARLACRCAIV